MIRLTKEEKAARYDALQTAINLTIANYEFRKKQSEEVANRFNSTGNNSLYALHTGWANAYGEILQDLKRWV